jgi:hypothetical protein
LPCIVNTQISDENDQIVAKKSGDHTVGHSSQKTPTEVFSKPFIFGVAGDLKNTPS